MEVEVVDANPVLQDDGTYVITVDSTTDEDNVSSSGYDDGGGAYSGGGNNGPDGLPDGKTSLREAILVANRHAGPDIIKFNIPLTDSGYDTPEFPDAFKIDVSGSYFIISTPSLIIDGTSQEQITGDLHTTIDEPNNMPVIGNATRGPEIIVDFASSINSSSAIIIKAGNVTIKGLGFYNKDSNRVITSLNAITPIENLMIENCDFVNNNYGALRITNSNNITIRNNVFQNNPTSGNGVDIVEGVDDEDATIEGNQFINNINSGIKWRSNNSSNVTISNNLIKFHDYVPGVEIKSGISIENNSVKYLIENNVLVENKQHNITIGVDGQVDVATATIRNNIIYGEDTILNINIHPEGEISPRTLNDVGDIDTGPNDVQNYPVIESVDYLGAGQYRISGDLDSNPSESPFTIEICESYDHPSGHGGCIQSLGTTTANSPWSTTVTIPGSDGTDNRIFSALATNSNGSTSEFSENFVASVSNPDYSIIEYDVELVYPIDNIEIDDTTPQLDWNPAVESETGFLDPDIHHYEIYIDGVYYDSTIDAVTQYQITSPLSLGSHNWQIVAFRQLGDGSFVETARSGVEDFIIIELIYSFEPVYPVDVTIDDTTPLFDWTDLDPESDFDYYELYVNDSLVATSILESEFDCELPTVTCELTEGNHSWYVIAFRIEDDSSITEVTRTSTANFSISIPVVPSIDDFVDDIESAVSNFSDSFVLFSQGLPALVAILTTISSFALMFPSVSDIFSAFGVLTGIVIPRKKKFWGIVFDQATSKPIPFAVIRLLDYHPNILKDSFVDSSSQLSAVSDQQKENTSSKLEASDSAKATSDKHSSSLLAQTISDLDGKYGLLVDQSGKFSIQVVADGYTPFFKDISVSPGSEVIFDIPLVLADKKANYFNKLKFVFKQNFVKYFRVFITILMIIGFFYSLFVTINYPITINYIILAAYGVLFILNLIVLVRELKREAGRVLDDDNKPIDGAIVRFYKDGSQLEVALSDSSGKLKVNLPSGDYNIKAFKQGYNLQKNLSNISINKNGFLIKDIRLEKTL
jgi:hypothetical protein